MVVNVTSTKWKQLLQGAIEPKLTSLALQIKINFLKLNVKTGKISIDDAVKELIEFCNKNNKAFENDIQTILY